MKRLVFAFALAAITFVAGYGTSKAAPIAPLPATVTDADNVIQAHYAYYWHHHYYRHRGWPYHHWCYW